MRAGAEAPNDPDIRHELEALDRMIRRDEHNERVLCTKMFSGIGVDGDEDKDGRNDRRDFESVDDDFFEDMDLRLQGMRDVNLNFATN